MKYLEYISKVTGSTQTSNSRLDAKVVVTLKYLNNFWRFVDLSLINCEIELVLRS